jgi:hypothetical protein
MEHASADVHIDLGLRHLGSCITFSKTRAVGRIFMNIKVLDAERDISVLVL